MSVKHLGYLLGILLCFILSSPAYALVQLYDSTINEAVKYGMENQDFGLNTFLGGNWVEGQNGELLNIYTPFMDIARSSARKRFLEKPSPESIAGARKKIKSDIDYIYMHPMVKFMVSLYGDSSGFGSKYFAVIEGVGKGRSYRLLPKVTIPQTMATKEEGVKVRPYTAINTYYFKFEDIYPLDEFNLKLYGKDITPVVFKVRTKDIQ